jgi:hypothetical protein
VSLVFVGHPAAALSIEGAPQLTPARMWKRVVKDGQTSRKPPQLIPL